MRTKKVTMAMTESNLYTSSPAEDRIQPGDALRMV